MKNLIPNSLVGCDNRDAGLECSAALTNDSFTYAGTTYRVVQADLGVSNTALIFSLDKVMPAERDAFSLIVDGETFPLASGSTVGRVNTGDSKRWGNSGLSWSVGDTVELSLVGPPPHPTVSISASPTTVDEGRPVTITLTLSSALSSRVTIPLVVYGFSAEPGDYGRLASITIPANSLTGTGIIATRQDADIRDDVFGVDLGTLPPEVVRGIWSVAITIVDDDYPVPTLPSLPIDYSHQRPASERTPTGEGAGGPFCYVGAGNGATEYIRYPDGRIEETTKQDPVIRSMFAC